MFVYELPPIDHGWGHLISVREMAATLLHDGKALSEVKELLDLFEVAKTLAQQCGWEGDFKDGEAYTLSIPYGGNDAFVYAFVWKQTNNGTTYVVSPVDMPHLSKWRRMSTVK